MSSQPISDFVSAPAPAPAQQFDLLLRETVHRGSNDLQMVIGLLALQSRRTASSEARRALTDAMERISVLARARREMGNHNRLPIALEQVCVALRPHAEPQSITIRLDVERDPVGLSATQVTTIALVVNELATNAIKHAFEEDKGGSITITLTSNEAGDVVVLIDDDGLPFPDPRRPARGGLGLELARRLMASIDGLFIPPGHGSKLFEMRLPIDASD